jgi:hypothetical protein
MSTSRQFPARVGDQGSERAELALALDERASPQLGHEQQSLRGRHETLG